MRKSDQLREVYKELRRVVGTEISAIDVARLAHLILRSYRDEENIIDTEQQSESRAFFYLAIDEAMSDGGWKILNFEKGYSGDKYNQELSTHYTLHRKLNKYLGPEWQKRFPPG